MRYPNLVPKSVCCTPIKFALYAEELDEDGAPIVVFEYDGKCNYQDSAKRVYIDDKHYIELTGKALFCGDICPELSVISGGEAEIFGEKRQIFRGTKARNPDGSVNYTSLELM